MKGYKVTDSNLRCRGKQYEIGKLFEHKGKLVPCKSGIHFCIQPVDCFNYYSFNSENRVFEVEAIGQVIHEGDKCVTSSLKFLRELTWARANGFKLSKFNPELNKTA